MRLSHCGTMQKKLGASVLQGVDIIKCLFSLSNKHTHTHTHTYIYIDDVNLVYLTLLHVSNVQPLSGMTWIQKKSKGERPLLTNSRYKNCYKIIMIIIILKTE